MSIDKNVYLLRKFGRKFTAQIDHIIININKRKFSNKNKIYDFVFIKSNIVDQILSEMNLLKNGFIDENEINISIIKNLRDTQIFYYNALIESLNLK